MMLNLIRNELLKLFRRAGTYVMISIVVLLIIGAGVIIKFVGTVEDSPADEVWKAQLAEQTEYHKTELEEFPDNTPYATHLERSIAINDYRIANNLTPFEKYSMWGFVNDVTPIIDIIGMFTIVVAASIVASEFGWGTIKLLLIRPISRTKILASKYFTVLIFGGLLLLTLYVLSVVLGAILFGAPDVAAPHLTYMNGKVTEQPMGLYLFVLYGFNSISMIMLATMAFMISAAFRNSSLAIGLSLFLLLMGNSITQIVALKYEWAKYILFANTDLMQYFDSVPLVEGMTLPFSVMMLIIYFVVFQFFAFYIFKKRDIAA